MLKVCSFIPCDGFGKALGVAIERVSVIASNVDKTDCKMIFVFKHWNVKKLRNYIEDTHFNHATLAGLSFRSTQFFFGRLWIVNINQA